MEKDLEERAKLYAIYTQRWEWPLKYHGQPQRFVPIVDRMLKPHVPEDITKFFWHGVDLRNLKEVRYNPSFGLELTYSEPRDCKKELISDHYGSEIIHVVHDVDVKDFFSFLSHRFYPNEIIKEAMFQIYLSLPHFSDETMEKARRTIRSIKEEEIAQIMLNHQDLLKDL